MIDQQGQLISFQLARKRYRNGAKAVMLAQKAVKLKPNVASLDTLAAAYAAVGNFESAIDTQKKAVQKLLAADQTSEVPRYMAHLNIYRSRQSLLIDYSAAPKPSKTKNLKNEINLLSLIGIVGDHEQKIKNNKEIEHRQISKNSKRWGGNPTVIFQKVSTTIGPTITTGIVRNP